METYFNGMVSLKERWDDLYPLLKILPKDNCLDIGCAEGLISYEIAKEANSVKAFDSRLDAIDLAKKECPKEFKEKIEFFQYDLWEYIQDQSVEFDLIFYLGVHHKLHDTIKQQAILQSLLERTKRQLIIRTYHIFLGSIALAADSKNFTFKTHTSPLPQNGTIFICEKKNES